MVIRLSMGDMTMKIIIVNNDSEVQGEIDLTGGNLDKSIAQSFLISEIVEIVDGREDE